MKAPFPWFGGKRRVADQVWEALGDVDNYVEPFAGSLAVLLERPTWHKGTCETVNDKDQFVANFWRALAHDPDGVADACDWPVNEADLFARHLWLVNTGRERLAAMDNDPDFYDIKVAGWWVWGINSWIGSGWCSGTGPHKHTESDPTGTAGQGINRQLPHLGDAGRGINRPHLGDAGRGINIYLNELAARLRGVRVCCGDWSRVVTRGALTYGTTTGVFLDPPYLGDVRTADLYAVDDHTIATEVRDWAIANGDNPGLRIILAGYEPEHVDHIPPTWRMVSYSASKAYGSSAGGGDNDTNRHLERLWFSPHCITTQGTLFEGLTT
jgi:DNA adenine methylase